MRLTTNVGACPASTLRSSCGRLHSLEPRVEDLHTWAGTKTGAPHCACIVITPFANAKMQEIILGSSMRIFNISTVPRHSNPSILLAIHLVKLATIQHTYTLLEKTITHYNLKTYISCLRASVLIFCSSSPLCG